MVLQESVLWKLQHDGTKYQQLPDDIIVDVSREVLYLRPMGIYNIRLRSLILRSELRDVEDLSIVEDTRSSALG